MPTLKRMFISGSDLKRKCASRKRSISASGTSFVHLRLPSGQPMHPLAYVDALLDGVRGPITPNAVLRFNAASGQKLTSAANRELLRRIEERAVDGLLTLDDLTWILGVGNSTVTIWCKNGLLPSSKIDSKTYASSSDLLSRCSWVIPTR